MEKHGGNIRVETRPGCTRFEIRLPIDGPPPVARAATVSAAHEAFPQRKGSASGETTN